MNMLLLKAIFVVFLLAKHHQVDALICSRYPTNTNMPKSPVDENFVVTISGNPQTYVLGQEYNVTIQAYNGVRFISFKLALENENGDPSLSQDLGHFELLDPVETRYSPNCINMVESTNTNPKTRIDVSWIAPEEPGYGCVLIRTTLLQHRDVWFMDDGGLTRRICEESVDEVESAPANAERNSCCACDEARYELTFEGTWSRNLHPKDFPAKGWITRFSDIVGASHTADYRFWEYGQMATEGMKEFAEHGSAQTLEREFNYNFKDGKIRTIIKARGPAFPNLNGQSLASIRVDPQHHLLSLASKIDPSPDWIVGVSGLELCVPNCTWLDQKTVTLYPWDVGTDAGPSYTSPDQPQVPADVIRRMRSDFPNDPRSPFFDNTGAPMKPLAILKIRRQRLYDRLCEDEDSNNFDVPRECYTHPWTAWSECTAKCGEGRQYRTRVYKQPEVANIFDCEVEMRQDRGCMGEDCGRDERRFDRVRGRDRNDEDDYLEGEEREDSTGSISRADCQLTGWAAWSPCSRTCGEGRMMRRRQYVNPMAEARCQGVKYARLVEYQKCMGRECLEGVRGGRRNQVIGEDDKQTEAHDEEEEEENGNEKEEEVEENEENGGVEARKEDEHQDNAVEVENEKVDEKEDLAKPDFSNWQQNRGRNSYGYRRPTNSQEQNRNADEEDEQEGEEVDEDGGDEDENGEEDEDKYGNLPNNRYGYGNRYNIAGQRRGNSNDDDQAEVNEGNRSPNRFGYNNRFYGGGRRPDEEENEVDQEEDAFESPNNRGRNRRPYSRFNPVGDLEEDLDTEPVETPAYCFKTLTMYPCLSSGTVRNYWFYNYCEDECMLFSANSCDKNENKFTSLEMCEETCRSPGNEELLLRKQRRGCSRANEPRKLRRKYSRF
ncbi:PREDICTED: spondin-1 [Rhagoletis zephyria]|uniref:spondin-1 n=1 Tax=Rhagoletis zephyria TaxID=28612 RepID=UPI0008117BCF|nr:PREDICTED: spondin-1 [Rhagoletis zephyria]